LELAFGVLVIVGAARAKKAQSVGVNRFGQTVGFKCASEMAKVVPSGFGRNKTPSDQESGGIVNRQKQNLFSAVGPPLVDGAVVLPEFADTGTAETAVGLRLRLGVGNEVCKVLFNKGFHGSARADKSVDAQEFVGD